jgi:hypothetical protein
MPYQLPSTIAVYEDIREPQVELPNAAFVASKLFRVEVFQETEVCILPSRICLHAGSNPTAR